MKWHNIAMWMRNKGVLVKTPENSSPMFTRVYRVLVSKLHAVETKNKNEKDQNYER